MKNENQLADITIRKVSDKCWTAQSSVPIADKEGNHDRYIDLRVAGKTQAGAIKNLEEDAATLQGK